MQKHVCRLYRAACMAAFVDNEKGQRRAANRKGTGLCSRWEKQWGQEDTGLGRTHGIRYSVLGGSKGNPTERSALPWSNLLMTQEPNMSTCCQALLLTYILPTTANSTFLNHESNHMPRQGLFLTQPKDYRVMPRYVVQQPLRKAMWQAGKANWTQVIQTQVLNRSFNATSGEFRQVVKLFKYHFVYL